MRNSKSGQKKLFQEGTQIFEQNFSKSVVLHIFQLFKVILPLPGMNLTEKTKEILKFRKFSKMKIFEKFLF